MTTLDVFITAYEIITGTTKPIQQLISNYVSVYEAFPSEYYFQLTETSYISTSYRDIIIGGGFTKTECETYASTRNLLTENFYRFDSNLMALAENFHDSIFNSGKHVSNLVDSYYYYCNDTPTTAHVNLFHVSDGSVTETGLEEDIDDAPGDGLVTSISATLADPLPPEESVFSGNHMTLVKNPNIWIQNIQQSLS